MGSQPFYHVRPNKYVDRQIFAEVLKSLSRNIEIQDYTYIGMGSYMFDDFKLLHNILGINKMISLENDPLMHKRALFNKPLKCIKMIQQSTTDYIANMDPGKNGHIFWLDYTDPAELGAQFDDFCRLVCTLNEYDIVRITLNANPTSLGKPTSEGEDLWEFRLDKLRQRLGDFVPVTVKSTDLVKKKYPLVLLSCLKKAYVKAIAGNERRFLPLYATVYDDNTQMLTLTGMVVLGKDNDLVFKQNKELKKYCNFEWNNPLTIFMPELTPKEVIHINNELPIKSEGKLIGKKYDFVFKKNPDMLQSYLRFYKEYPNFHPINL